MQMENKKFIGYEYKEVHTDRSKVDLMQDGYECFGWELLEVKKIGPSKVSRMQSMYIKMRRDRKIINKMELTRLQRNFEACLKELELLEAAKTTKATIVALIIGLLGTGFMTGSVLAVTAEPPKVLLSIFFAIPAFIGWTLPVFVYRHIVRKETEKYTPLIEAKYDEIYEICEKGNKLLH